MTTRSVVIALLLFTPMTVFALGDLMLTKEQRDEIDALREGRTVNKTIVHSSPTTSSRAPTPNLTVNGFYFRNDDRNAPTLWVNGEQSLDNKLTHKITVKRVNKDKQSVRITTSSTSKAPSSVKAGQKIDTENGVVTESYEQQR